MRFSLTFFLIHHLLRSIWANCIGLIYKIVYKIRFKFNKELYEKYKTNKKIFDDIKTLTDVRRYFIDKFIYKYDGIKGIFDRNNSKEEFFSDGGDCDDMSRYTKKALKKIGIKNILCVGFVAKAKPVLFWHYDIIYKINDEYILFNYGSSFKCDTFMECIDKVYEIFSKCSNYKFSDNKNDLKYFPVLWF